MRSGRERKEVSLYNCNDSQTILRRILALCPHFLNSALYRNSSALILTFVCCVCADVHICVCSIAGHIVSLSGEDLFHFLSVVVCWRCAWILFCSSYSALARARVHLSVRVRDLYLLLLSWAKMACFIFGPAPDSWF